MVKILSIDCGFISESWDRNFGMQNKDQNGNKEQNVEKLLEMDGYQIFKNVHQRERRGGKPLLLIKTDKYYVTELCPNIITVPIELEITWALITPKIKFGNSAVKKIIVASIYYTEKTPKAKFIDHISHSFHFLLSKYGEGVDWIFSGDFNKCNIKPILSLSNNLKQIVKFPTRLNPDNTLDLIITSLSHWYRDPTPLPPLECDSDKKGLPSDHIPVFWQPLDENFPTKKQRIVKYRPMKQSSIQGFGQWISTYDWSEVYAMETAHEKALLFQNILMEHYNFYFPEETLKFREDDKPWVNKEVKRADRQQRRAWVKDKFSKKYKTLNISYLDICKKAKETYYRKTISNLKEANISQWYRNIKRISSSNYHKESETEVEQIKGQPIVQQSELIADQFSKVSQLYSRLQSERINLEEALYDTELPPVEPWNVTLIIKDVKAKRSTALGDLPMKLIKEFDVFLAEPLSHIWKRCLAHGEYPDVWKLEIVTPMPKVYPPKETKDLRKISVTKNFSKLFEKYICKIIIEDISKSADKAQYGCKKKVGIQHLLVKLADRILTALDKNNQQEVYGVILQLVDWSQAFDRQCPQLAIESFMKNGVRKSLIPTLINYFQDRKMQVKWKNILSTIRELPG